MQRYLKERPICLIESAITAFFLFIFTRDYGTTVTTVSIAGLQIQSLGVTLGIFRYTLHFLVEFLK